MLILDMFFLAQAQINKIECNLLLNEEVMMHKQEKIFQILLK